MHVDSLMYMLKRLSSLIPHLYESINNKIFGKVAGFKKTPLSKHPSVNILASHWRTRHKIYFPWHSENFLYFMEPLFNQVKGR